MPGTECRPVVPDLLQGRGKGWARTLAGLLLATLAAPAMAQFATGGSGLYKGDVLWFGWGNPGAPVPNGRAVTNSYTVAGQTFSVTCTVNNITQQQGVGGLVAYRPGNYVADGLDNLYNIGGTGTANQLAIGLATAANGTANRVAFDLACNATSGGAPFAMEGFVFAEAETSLSNELVELTSPGIPHLIDRFSTCTTTSPTSPSSVATRSGNTTSMSGRTIEDCGTSGGGPMAVSFVENVGSSISAQMRAGSTTLAPGVSAVAVGILVRRGDVGDAPASYGNVVHLQTPQFVGGTITNGMALNDPNTPLATLLEPPLRLGARVDADTGTHASANADGDDLFEEDDEDAITGTPRVRLEPGASHTLPNIPCSGPGVLYGYIDFNRDGDFTDPNERSAPTSCAAGTNNVSVSWTQPAAAGLSSGPSFLRLRLAATDAEAAQPTGSAGAGEVEDHPVVLGSVALTKLWTDNPVAGDTVSLAITGATGETPGSSTAPSTTTPARGIATPGSVVTLTEAFTVGSAANYTTTLACVRDNDGVAVPSSGSGLSRTFTMPSDSAVTCTYTNARQPADLQILKDDGVTSVERGATTVYTITVNNAGPGDGSGAIVKDTPGAGLGNCQVTNCTPAASCPATPGDILTPAGGVLPAFPSGASAVFTMSCDVTLP